MGAGHVIPDFSPILPDGPHKDGVPVDIFIAPGLWVDVSGGQGSRPIVRFHARKIVFPKFKGVF
jgi:hypothetical protein